MRWLLVCRKGVLSAEEDASAHAHTVALQNQLSVVL
jgi:hypothetical protein